MGRGGRISYSIGSVYKSVSGFWRVLGDLRHGHWKAFDNHISVEWLQEVLGHQGPVDTGIFVFVQLGQHALSGRTPF